MEVFRLTRKPFSKVLSGFGASIKGARWNSQGVEIIYTAENRSLAMAELAVHLTAAMLPDDYVMLTIDIPNNIPVEGLSEKSLPKNWNVFPHTKATQLLGDEFITENKYCILKVPSVVTKGDFNLLINPRHPDFKKIKIIKREDFPFDQRLFK